MTGKTWWHRWLDKPWLGRNPPLHVAVMAGRVDVFDMLVRLGADPCGRGAQGLSVLHTAVLQPQLEAAEPFLERALAAGIDIDDRDGDGYTALHMAVYHDRRAIVQWLLDHGASVRARTELGRTPLRHAVDRHKLIATRTLLQAGAFVDERDTDGETPLQQAAEPAVADLLLEFGADVHAVNNGGENLLHLAAARGDPHMLRWGLAHGVSPRVVNALGQTPLRALQVEIPGLFGSAGGLRAQFADERRSTDWPHVQPQAAGEWALALALLGDPRFADVGEA